MRLSASWGGWRQWPIPKRILPFWFLERFSGQLFVTSLAVRAVKNRVPAIALSFKKSRAMESEPASHVFEHRSLRGGSRILALIAGSLLGLVHITSEAAPANRPTAQAACNTTTTTSHQCTYAAAVLAGSLLYACVRDTLSVTVWVSASDSVNGTWTAVANTDRTLPGMSLKKACFYFQNSAAGTPTVTVTSTGNGTLRQLVLTEWTGVALTGGPVDSDGNDISASDPITCSSSTATAANQLMIADISKAFGAAPNNGETEIYEEGSNRLQIEYKLTSGSGSIAATWDLTSSDSISCSQSIWAEASTGNPLRGPIGWPRGPIR